MWKAVVSQRMEMILKGLMKRDGKRDKIIFNPSPFPQKNITVHFQGHKVFMLWSGAEPVFFKKPKHHHIHRLILLILSL